MSPSDMTPIDARADTMSSEYPEVDRRAWAQPSDLPEVVPQSFPEAYGYVRARVEPGEKEPKYLAYGQAGMEVKNDIVSPLSPVDTHDVEIAAQSLPEEPSSEDTSSAKSKHLLRGFTPWRVLILAVVVILAAVGGGVGGGIAASRSQSSTTAQSASTTR